MAKHSKRCAKPGCRAWAMRGEELCYAHIMMKRRFFTEEGVQETEAVASSSLRDPAGKDFMFKASEWAYYYNYDRSHDGLGGKSPAEALQQVNPMLPSLQDPEGKEILFLPPIILDGTITLLGGGTGVYRHYRSGLPQAVMLPGAFSPIPGGAVDPIIAKAPYRNGHPCSPTEHIL